jgi:hypothetical protein
MLRARTVGSLAQGIKRKRSTLSLNTKHKAFTGEAYP